jgi:hypothetical protein
MPATELVEIVFRTGSAERARDFTARRAKNSRCRGLQAAFVVARVADVIVEVPRLATIG